jgi:SSS family solute:Na+ symporter
MIDAVIVVGYLCAMLVIGWNSRSQSPESYWVADRQYGTGRISMSLVATIFGASSTMGIIGLGYLRGFTAAWWSLVGAVALLVFGLTLAGRIRKLGVYTLPDILKQAYGNMVAVPAAILIVVAWSGILAAQMIAGATLLSGVLPLEYTTALMMVTAVFVVYTFWGGQLSVVKTDTWQLMLFLGALLASFAFVVLATKSSIGSLFGSAPRGHLSFPVSDTFGWYDVLVFYPLIIGLPYLVGPDIYSRVLCARDDSVARRSALISAMAIIPISLVLAALGVLLRELYPGIAQEAALPAAIDQLIPAGLAGLIATGFLAAIMSSADTTLVSASTILSLNVVAAGTEMARARQLVTTRVAVLGVGLGAGVIAAFQQGIISSLLLAYTIFVGGVVIPTLGSFYRSPLRITPAGAMSAVIVGGSVAILGRIDDGAVLRVVLGDTGDVLLGRLLGRGYPSILPIILSLIAMLTVSWTSGKSRLQPEQDG